MGMRPPWVRMGPKPNNEGPCRRQEGEIHRHAEEAVWRGRQRLEAAAMAQGRPELEGQWGSPGARTGSPAHLSIGRLASGLLRRYIPGAWVQPVCGHLLQLPQDTRRGCISQVGKLSLQNRYCKVTPLRGLHGRQVACGLVRKTGPRHRIPQPGGSRVCPQGAV